MRDEDPSPEDIARFSDDTVRCPACGAEAWDEIEMCPKCGESMTRVSPGRWFQHRLTAAIAVIVVIALLIMMGIIRF